MSTKRVRESHPRHVEHDIRHRSPPLGDRLTRQFAAASVTIEEWPVDISRDGASVIEPG